MKKNCRLSAPHKDSLGVQLIIAIYDIMMTTILIEFDWKNTEFKSRFTHYMEKAELKWPSMDEVKQKTRDYPQEKQQTLLHVISSHEEAKA